MRWGVGWRYGQNYVFKTISLCKLLEALVADELRSIVTHDCSSNPALCENGLCHHGGQLTEFRVIVMIVNQKQVILAL